MKEQIRKKIVFSPAFGIVIYLCLYVSASFLYPGGSQHDSGSTGFSWTYNYWCDLINERAGNGQLNEARPVALAAQFILCISLVLFWLIFPSCFPDRAAALITRAFGVISMLTALMLFTEYHDTVIDVSGVTGAIAMLITFGQLYKMKKGGLITLGLLCFCLAALNYIIYLSRIGIPALPLLQKLTFLMSFLWFFLLNRLLWRQGDNP